jgi:Holliday junction resolvase RusA-like endonuclease
MRIEVPMLPPKELTPNRLSCWGARYRTGQEYHRAVYYSCMEARHKFNSLPIRKAKLDLTFVFAQKRKRDIDNLRASFKAGQDALVNAGLIVDDSSEFLELGAINIEIDKTRAPLTIIELEERE